MNDPYVDAYHRELDRLHPHLWANLEIVPTLAPDSAQSRAVVKYLVSLACQPSHIMPITLGRRALVRIPREWLAGCIEEIAGEVIDPRDNWEYRRYLEVCCFVDPVVAERVASEGLHSCNVDVREAATEFAGRCRDFAERTRTDWLGEPPL